MHSGDNVVFVFYCLHIGEVLLPAFADCVLVFSVEQGWMKIHLLDGLLDQGQ